MWISRIALRNFKSYQNQVFEFPQPANGRIWCWSGRQWLWQDHLAGGDLYRSVR
jgi:hypothetical protein